MAESAGAQVKTLASLNQLLRGFDASHATASKTEELWVYENKEIVNRPVTYHPALYHIFDHMLLLVAAQNPTMDTLVVDIDQKENSIEICGKGLNAIRIDVDEEFHRQIFYYFEELKIDTAYDGKRSEQAFLQKDKSANKPLPKSVTSRAKYTKLKYKPDLRKFGMTKLEDDDVAMMNKRVVDMAGCLGEGMTVLLNRREVMLIRKKVRHKKVPAPAVLNPFEGYFHLYLDSADNELPRMFTKVQDSWEVCLSIREGKFEQVSFVNSIATVKGGSHVNHITKQITDHLIKVLNKKYKNANLQAVHVKNYLWVFVNALIDNPIIDAVALSQEPLIEPNSFGSQFKLPERFLEKAAEHAEEILFPEELKRRLKIQIPKLVDAKLAGMLQYECTLIVVEGDSAISLARAGIATFNRETRDLYGLYPLSGKLANVRNTNVTKAMLDYVEVKNLKKILGLKIGADYQNARSLRYRHLMIMTDQDFDGYHIKGLIINLIYSFWPSLLKVNPSFLMEFKTPIIKAIEKKTGKEEKFYWTQDYESWNVNLSGGSASDWHIRYYKGLGTNTVREGMEYFKEDELRAHRRFFNWIAKKDGTALDIAFSQSKIKERKVWLEEGQSLQLSQRVQPVVRMNPDMNDLLIPSFTYEQYVYNELRPFALESLRRCIPSLLDGLKPSQRKVLYSAFKRQNFIEETRVHDFSGFVSDTSAYHHGGQNLDKTIIKMAQDFVGRNNINLLLPLGQFGSRYKGGKDHAASHYINTKLSPITRYIFVEDDDMIVPYLQEDGKSVEPKFYLPIIPLALVNGCKGTGTGFSTFIPCFSLVVVLENLRRLIMGEEEKMGLKPMIPCYRGYKGTIVKDPASDYTYIARGLIEQVDAITLKIKELPIGKWTVDYEAFLEIISQPNYKGKGPIIEAYTNLGNDSDIEIQVELSEENLNVAKQKGLVEKFGLARRISIKNMHLHNKDGIIKKYDTPEQIIKEFYGARLEYYNLRLGAKKKKLELENEILDNKIRFITLVGKKEIDLSVKRPEILDKLTQNKFRRIPENNSEAVISDFHYLLSMSLESLCYETLEELKAEKMIVQEKFDVLRKLNSQSLWLEDLNALERQFHVMEKEKKDEVVPHQAEEVVPHQADEVVPHQAEEEPDSEDEESDSEGEESDSEGEESGSDGEEADMVEDLNDLNWFLQEDEPPQPQEDEPPQPQEDEPPQPQEDEPPQPQEDEPPQPQEDEPPQPQEDEPPQPQEDEPPQPQLRRSSRIAAQNRR